jgi:hypothetical protein
MPATNRELVELTMTDCQLNESESAQQLISILRESGCEFIYGKNPDSSPESRIRRGSIIAPLDFTHPLLVRDATSKVLQQKGGVGSLSFIARGKKLSISQAPEPSGKGLDALASGLLEFLKRQYVALHPSYSSVDEMGENALPKLTTSADAVRFLFWANIFGPKIVKQVGEQFLLDCPGKVELLEDRGIVLVSSKSFTTWLERPPHKVVTYLVQKFPNMKLYRSAGVDIS